jgi:glutamate-5-semialdehyde dehydrogenase
MEIQENIKSTYSASKVLQNTSIEIINNVLIDLSEIIKSQVIEIQAENKKDLNLMNPSDAKYDRLLLTEKRITDLASALIHVAGLDYKFGQITEERTLESGIKLQKLSVPMGVIGIIFESRPNVTIDVAALCLKSGNAAILKGGKEAFYSNTFLVNLIHKALIKNNLPASLVQLFPTDRQYLNELLEATKYVDLIIPRGSQSLIDYVRANSKIPTIETGAGVCHTYVEQTANLKTAANIVINARASRPSVCNSLDSLLLDEKIAHEFIPLLIADLVKYEITVYADDVCFEIFKENGFEKLEKASEETYRTEWLDFKLNVSLVNGIDQALAHIETYSSKHSEAILTENIDLAEQFLSKVDAAAVYHNASTRFTDGEMFGLGAEIGISTQKLHARGPFALEKLSTEKWVCRGDGQVRW